MDNENKEINSIAELFKQRNITIPVIQRDYAQGRDEDSAKSIREDFINSLFEAVNDDKEMDINYIYGISKSGGNFLPIDGQQRITSIFLFLWFCAVKEEKTELFCKYMKKFSYMVRVSAEEFFDILQERSDGRDPVLKYNDDFKEYADRKVVGQRVVDKKAPKTEPVIRSLRDFNWYKLEWDNDTTIDGAIRFLECVREKYNKKDPNISFTEKLLGDDCPIKLIFIEQSNTSDEKDSSKSESLDFEAENRAAITYINMNERGKLLNDFENLKAYLCRLDNKDKDAQSFLTKYDSDYINNFMQLGGNTGSLSYQVKKADETAFNFLSHVYCDLKGIPNEKKWPIYTFMGKLNAEQEGGKKVFPDDYFEFMRSVIETLDDNNKRWMIDYCDQYNEPNRYRFYLFFWAVYKELSKDDYWEKLKEHMKLADEKLYVNKKFPYIKDLIDILSSGSSQKGGLLNYLAEMDPDDSRILLPVMTYDNLTYGDKTSWKEEQIKARCLLKCSKDLSDKMEHIGSKFNHQIRFLLYMSGLWNGNITQDGLEALDKYIGIADVLVFNTFEWKKIFYLSSLDGNDPPSLPKPQETTVWSDKYLYWSDENVLNEKLINRIKWCFDKIFETSKENAVDYKEALEKYVEAEKARLDKNIWLYYVLDRNYDELFKNMVKIKDGVYTYNDVSNGCQNFYEFVMQKDLEAFKKLELLPYAVISENSDYRLKSVKKDGSNAKNGLAAISFCNKFKDHSFRYFKDEEILYRYKYKECKKTESDCNEDFFELESNNSAIKDFEYEYKNCFDAIKDVINKILKDDKDTDTILRKWMFDRYIEDLKTALKDHPTLKDYSLECERKGQSKIYITLTKEVGYSSEKNEEPAHSAFFEKFKEVSAN